MNSSPKTAILGYIIIVLDVLHMVGEYTKTNSLPTDLQGWIVFAGGLAMGIGLILAKDFDKSNAIHMQTTSSVPANVPIAPAPKDPPTPIG